MAKHAGHNRAMGTYSLLSDFTSLEFFLIIFFIKLIIAANMTLKIKLKIKLKIYEKTRILDIKPAFTTKLKLLFINIITLKIIHEIMFVIPNPKVERIRLIKSDNAVNINDTFMKVVKEFISVKTLTILDNVPNTEQLLKLKTNTIKIVAIENDLDNFIIID